MIIHVLHLYRHDGQYDGEPYEVGQYLYRSYDNLKDEQKRLQEKDIGLSFSWSTLHTQD